MAEEKKLNRGWVKNAAIIFLSIMLVLTFFSNTIMNRTLPEVAVQYVQSGTINAQIRGTGTVTANGTYEVIVNQTRKVESVAVKLGDSVEMGDLLFVLAGSESEELKAAKETLNSMKLQYSIDLINASAAYADDKRAIEQAQQDLQEKIAKRAESGDATAQALTAAHAEVNDLKEDISELQQDQADTGYSGQNDSDIRKQEKLRDDKLAERDAILDHNSAEWEALDEEWKDIKTELGYMNDSIELGEDIADKQEDLTAAEAYLSDLEDMFAAWTAADAEVAAAQKTLDNLVYQLEQKQKVDGTINNLNLEASKAKIASQQQVVNELAKDAVSSEITAPMAGIVTTINVVAGGTTSGSDPLAVLEAPDRGYYLQFTVTAEQARKVTLGDTAQVSDYYWGPEIKATLAAIKNDPEKPGQNKILVFTLEGEVTSASQLTLSIGQRSANYQLIVPNSALRSDSSGDFVLIVDAKNTPLGNRYIARRVDVQILDKDDTNTAISAGLAGYEYVITTASKPLEPGDQVRLVDQ
jgi:multidrug efflux pump subunit AcrA (membrane-fusion protein)